MNIQLTPQNIYGSTQYIDNNTNITAFKANNRWYASINGCMFDAGFCNISNLNSFYSRYPEYEESLNMLGYFSQNNSFINDTDKIFSEISIKDEGVFSSITQIIDDSGQSHTYKYTSNKIEDIENHILDIYDKWNIDIFSSVTISSSEDVKHVIEAKMTSRDLAKNLVRVKSSNLWSYGINIKDRKDKKGDVIVQFKDKHGGPGDLYQYLDVPVNVWRKWLAAPSKGHFLWANIRHEYKYRKLTGDKRGKLPNAIN